MICAAIALFSACIIVLGQVQLTNLDQKSFTVDIAAPVTNIVNLNLRRSQFSPSTSGWILTNISGVYGGSTNIITNSIWGIDGFGNITPVVTNNAVIATNIVRYGAGRMFGTESWLSKAITLTNGPNYLGAAENSQFFLIGPTTNPADCQIILSNAVATGQKLVLVNQTNAIPAEGAWTMTNNTPIPDGAGVVKLLGGYDLLSTNGYISYFEFISPDWQEVGRILSSGASGLLTNVFNNIVVYSNITLKGNASLTINNVTLTTNDIWHTNIVAGVTNLQPVNLNLPVVISNTLSFQGNSGTNFLSASGNNLTWKSLSSTPQIVLNDGSTSTTYAPAGITDAGTSGAFQLYVNGSGGGATAIQLQGVGATHFLTPVTADVQLGYSGTSFLWEGSAISTRNRPSQWWGYSSVTGSADFELSHSGTNGVVLFNSVAINDAGVPRDLSFASNGVQIARINMNSGYTGTGTNVFLDNGTFGAVPGGSGGGTVGTVINTTSSTAGQLLTMSGTDPTNTVPATGVSVVGGTNLTATGSLAVGTGSVFGTGGASNSVDSMVLISRAINDANGSGNAHGFSDSSIITRSNRMAYNSFDCRLQFAGTNQFDHYAGLQFAPYFTNSCLISNVYGMYAAANDNNTTNYQNWYGVKIIPPAGNFSAGRHAYGLYIDPANSVNLTDIPLAVGTSAVPCQFGTPVQINNGTGENRIGLGVSLTTRAGYGVDSYGKISSAGTSAGSVREGIITENWGVTSGSGSAFVAKIGQQTTTNLFGVEGTFNTTYSNIWSTIKVKGDDGYLSRINFAQLGVLIGTNHTDLPTSTLQVAGSMAHSIATGTAITLGNTNEVYLANVDAQTITLPSAVGIRGRTYTIKTVAPASTATVSTNGPAGQFIDGAGTYSLTASNKFVSVISDNVTWWIIGNN